MYSGISTATVLLLVSLIISGVASWTYTDARRWGEIYGMCDGVRQSPVALSYATSAFAPYLRPVQFYESAKFNTTERFTVKNAGNTLQINLPGCKWYLAMTDRYENDYCVAQIHFHWGKDSRRGSEHSLEGRFYPLEMHIVTFNTKLYSNLTEAAFNAHGLAVVGVFFEENKAINSNNTQLYKMRSFLGVIEDVRRYDTSTSLLPFDYQHLLPFTEKELGMFYRYDGSLTTPPCTENVIWTVMRTPLSVTPDQLAAFRSLQIFSTDNQSRTMGNYRELQNLNSYSVFVPRTVFRSWNSASFNQQLFGIFAIYALFIEF